MRNNQSLLILILFSVFFIQCKKDPGSSNVPDPVIETPLPITATVQGNVYNNNNVPAAGVTVKVGSKSAITDSKGYFRIVNAALDKRSSVVTAEMNGYFKAYRTFSATSGTNHIEFKLIRRILSGTISAVTGGAVSLTNGAKVQLPANGVMVASSGAAYSGTVNVYASYIDPTSNDIEQTVPGSFMANDANGTRVLLESYGMMVVELSSPSGEKLQVKTGSTSKLTMPIPSSIQGSAPASIPLWYVDEQTGIWKEEGSAAKTGNLYVGEVKHFTPWNCDIPVPTVPINFILQNASGDPLVHASVKIKVASPTGLGMVSGYTDSLGQANPMVPANQALIMTLNDPCGTIIYSQNIGPFNQATNIGLITISNTVSASATISGTLKNCSGNTVTNGYAVFEYNNVVRYDKVDVNGNFSINFIKCINSAPAIVVGVDSITNVQGNPQNIVISQTVTNIGNYSVCGYSSPQYINFTLDGINHSIPGLGTDTLTGYTVSQGSPFLTGISGASFSNNNGVHFQFNSPGLVPGTYPLKYIKVNGIETFNPPISVNLTNFSLNSSEFYEGNLSGSFTSLGVSHTVTLNFRVQRDF